MAQLNGQPGEIRFTIEVKRAATGKVEKHEMIGKITDGGNAQHGRAERRD